MCPDTPCANGKPREAHSCKCLPDGLPSLAHSIKTEYIAETEMMQITWERTGSTPVIGYNVFLKGQQVHCDEEPLMISPDSKCFVKTNTLFWWNAGNYGANDIVAAQI